MVPSEEIPPSSDRPTNPACPISKSPTSLRVPPNQVPQLPQEADLLHELANALGCALGRMNMLERELQGTAPEERARLSHLSRAVTEALELAVKMVREIREEQGAGTRLQPLASLLRSAVRLVGPGLSSATALEVRCDERVLVRGREGTILRLLMNLLNHAMQEGDGGPPSRVRVMVEASLKTAHLLVEDSRPGATGSFPEPRVEAHGQAHSLELAVSQRLVSELAGSMTVVTTAGHGTRVFIELPGPGAEQGT